MHYGDIRIKDNHKNKKCFKCKLTATKEIEIGEAPASWNDGNMSRFEYYCDEHFEEWNNKRKQITPEKMERMIDGLMQTGMNEKEARKFIMNHFSPNANKRKNLN